MEHIILNLIPYLEHLNDWGYLILFLGALLESTILVGYFTPGTTIVIIFGMLAGGGYYDFGDVLFVAILGNILGNVLSFFIGKHYGKKVLKDGFYFIKPEHLKKASDFINKYSGRSIFFGKLIPAVKENIPFVAGILKMPFSKFLFWNILGAIAWSLIFVGVGYIFSSSFELAKIWSGRLSLAILILFFVIIIFTLIRIYSVKLGKFTISIFNSFVNFIWNKIKKSTFIKKHPKLFLFIENRFRKDRFTGLPLTVFLGIFLYLFFGFIGFTDATFENPIMKNIDINTSHLMYYFYNIILVKIFLIISFFGNAYFIMIASLFFGIYYFFRRKFNMLFSFLITIFSTSFITIFVKYLIHRPRPELATYFVNSYSFPSFHSAISVAFYGFLAWLLIRKTNKWNEKVNWFIGFLIITFVIGFSRIYLNVHYVSDVLGGYLVGAIGLVFGITIYEYIININNEKEKNYKNISTLGKFIVVLLFAGCSVSYFVYYFSHIQYLHPEQRNQTIEIKNILNYLNKHPKLKYTETIAGRKTEPINFIFLAKSDKDLITIFKKAGFTPADKITFDSIVKIGNSLYDKKPYYNAPMLPLYWNGKLQNFNFQLVDNPENIRLRHHIRIWKTNLKQGDYNVYVACAVYDDGIKWYITHKIDPNIDKERNFIFEQLKKTGMVKAYKLIQLVEGYIGYNFSYDKFFTDGKAYLLKLEK